MQYIVSTVQIFQFANIIFIISANFILFQSVLYNSNKLCIIQAWNFSIYLLAVILQLYCDTSLVNKAYKIILDIVLTFASTSNIEYYKL